MLQIILQSFVRAEVTIGLVLSVLLITGRGDVPTIALSLGGIGLFLLVHGLLPLARRSTPLPCPSPKAPASATEMAREEAAADSEAEPTREDAPPPKIQTGCKQPSRGSIVARAVLSSLIIIATAGLIYFLAPIISQV